MPGKYIPKLFYALAFLLPLIFSNLTSELFEFNKMLFVYFMTVLILWAFMASVSLQSLKKQVKKFELKIPIVIFLLALAISTLLSIDFKTSLLGYYSRFHGGLLSYISYSILAFIFTATMAKKQVIHFTKVLLLSTTIASVYASLEHFGFSPSCLLVTQKFDVGCWVQDVQNRVFGTFGQPNWLAAWLAAILPLSWYMAIKTKTKIKYLYVIASIFFTLTLHYTKSRSAFLALIAVLVIFWSGLTFINKDKFRKNLSTFLLVCLATFLIAFSVETPWKPNIISLVKAQEYSVPALEKGGTESAVIRKIVWKGALDLFRKYPIFGTGLDTFAFSYYETRPKEHNLTSEWNYIYNRAHNEYLNFMATIGIVGTLAYLALIASFLHVFFAKGGQRSLNLSLLAGFVSILITNFFGFSTVSTGFLFFIFPAAAIAAKNREIYFPKPFAQKDFKSAYIFSPIAIVSLALITLYWLADYNYAKGKKLVDIDPEISAKRLETAIKINPEAIYYNELAKAYLKLGKVFEAESAARKALDYSPRNVAIHKQVANLYHKMSVYDKNYLAKEFRVLEKLLEMAPTDPSTSYQYASFLARIGQTQEAITQLEKTIELKTDYKIARKLLGYIYEDLGDKQKAKQQYKKILEYYPQDEIIQKDLEGLGD